MILFISYFSNFNVIFNFSERIKSQQLSIFEIIKKYKGKRVVERFHFQFNDSKKFGIADNDTFYYT